MSEAKFTRGNWVIVSDENSIEIAELEKDWHICNMNGRCDNSIHDANLISASPDLYAEIERDLIEQLKTQELIKGKLVDERLNASIVRKQNLLAKARGKL